MSSSKTLLAILVSLGLAAQTPPPAPPTPPVPQTDPSGKPPPEPAPAPSVQPQTPPVADPKPSSPENPVAVPAEAKAILFFYRESRFMGGGLRPSLYVDDVEVAWISSGSYLKVAVPAGDHLIYADNKDEALTFPTESGTTYYFRVGIRAGILKGHGKLEPVSEEAGAKEFESWKAKMTYAEKILKPDMIVKD